MYRPKPRRRLQTVGIAGWRAIRGGYGFTTKGVGAFFCEICGDRKVYGRDLLHEELCWRCWLLEVAEPLLEGAEGDIIG